MKVWLSDIWWLLGGRESLNPHWNVRCAYRKEVRHIAIIAFVLGCLTTTGAALIIGAFR